MMTIPFIDDEIRGPVQVFGAGNIGKSVVYLLKKYEIEVWRVFDNNETVIGKYIWWDVPCTNPNEGDRTLPVILSVSQKDAVISIRKQCEELGYKCIYVINMDMFEECCNMLSDKDFLEMKYYSRLGKRLYLDNPVRLNEKLQWLKIHDRNPLYVKLADKYAVRDYLREKFGEGYLIPLLYMSYDVDDLKLENIPDTHCVIKTNAWSGDAVLVRDKNTIDIEKLRKKFSKIFQADYSRNGREWWYGRMKTCLLIEKMLETSEGKIPNDYKLHFINGKLEFIYCSIDREGLNYRKIYSPDWREMNFSWNGEGAPPSTGMPNIEPPINFGEMIRMGNEIAKGIPYVRVDYYEVDRNLYFGEITLSHGGGFDRFIPDDYDEIYGRKLNIPTKSGDSISHYLEMFRPYAAPVHGFWKVSKEERKNCIKLDWNEATLLPSSYVMDRVLTLAREKSVYYRYPCTENKKLQQMVSEYVGVSSEMILMIPSSDVGHEIIARVWSRERDKCGIVWPSYDNFRASMELTGAKVQLINMPELLFDEDLVRKYIDKERPKLLYICNPNNPTGEQISVSTIEALVLDYPDVLFIIDEAYGEFSNVSSVSLTKKHGNIIITRTFSKAFGLAGFRIGFIVSSLDSIRLMSDVRNSKNITMFAQEAATAALEDKNAMLDYVWQVREAKNSFENDINNLWFIKKIYHSETNFLMIELENHVEKERLLTFLERHRIFVRNIGQTGFIKEHCIRISIGTKEQMSVVANVMRKFR